jgi:hypothetical protein
MRFYLDEDIASQTLIKILISAGHDVITTYEARLSGSSDEDQLIYATKTHRIIISGNVKDFLLLNKEWISEGKSHCGIMLIQRRRNDRANADRILAFARLHSDKDSLANMVFFP